MKPHRTVSFLILLCLINACASTGDAYLKQLASNEPHAVLKFESEDVGHIFPVTIPVVAPSSINGRLIDKTRENWKMHAFEEFLTPPGDTIVSISYSGRDVYGRGIIRFSAKRDEVYEVKHTIKEGIIVFEVTDSKHQIITSSSQFKNKIQIYGGSDHDLASALFEASAEGDTKHVRALLNDGAEPDWDGPRGFTSLIVAASRGHTDTVKILIDAGANVNASARGWTPLIFAADRGYKSIVSMLLDAGANINFSRAGDYNALMAAAEHGYTDMVKLLLQKRAYTRARYLNGKTALDFAKEAGNQEIVDMLEEVNLQQ